MTDEQKIDAITLATDLTVAWLANPNTRVTAEAVPTFLAAVHAAVQTLGTPQAGAQLATEPQYHAPATTVRKSLMTPGRIISMIDGKPYASLKRHLNAHGLTPAEYRQRYGLKSDYPMISPQYSEARRATAKRLGLGRKPGQGQVPDAVAKPLKAAKKTITQALRSARERLGGAEADGPDAPPTSE